MLRNKKILLFLIIIVYLLSLVPYIIASNAGEAGIIIKNQKIDKDSLPNDIQDLLVYKEDSYNLILLEDPATKVIELGSLKINERKLILSNKTVEMNRFVRVENMTTDIYVTSYNIINQQFDKLIIGDPTEAEFGSIIETINYYIGMINSYSSSAILTISDIVIISKVAFYAGGLLIVLILAFLINRMFALWNIPAIAAAYSFQFFLADLTSLLNKVDVDDSHMIFGFIFIILIPLTVWMKSYEKSEKGMRRIHELYTKNQKILLKIKSKFGM